MNLSRRGSFYFQFHFHGFHNDHIVSGFYSRAFRYRVTDDRPGNRSEDHSPACGRGWRYRCRRRGRGNRGSWRYRNRTWHAANFSDGLLGRNCSARGQSRAGSQIQR